MAAVKKSDIPMVSAFMVDFWEYVKAVWLVEDNEAYWKDVCQRANVLLERYEDRFCRGQVLRFLDYLDSVLKPESTAKEGWSYGKPFE